MDNSQKSVLKKKTILLASDHAGFALKNEVRDFLRGQGRQVEDMGANTFDPDDNYPELIMPAAMRIAEHPEKYVAIIFGKSGQGEAMVANRFPAVRAIVYYGGDVGGGISGGSATSDKAGEKKNTALDIIRLGREHNDSNVLSLGADFLTKEEACAAVELWLATPFSGEERHQRRIEMIDSVA